ncbi:hypothetical protein A6F65_00406 [Paraurantiacibacter namhicola]|uniref:Uncharacterized protein n=2 Tax=Paraurantiacibacter namhicola TaxID=645517 RepID=A0A1C7D5X5_9SPHN|nr:hypothetical protein A6F65_00406 [Paraurantiacibacter namhicola]
MAYYAFLAMVPLMAVAVLSYGLFVDPETLARHAQAIAGALPQSAAELVTSQLEAVVETRSGAKGIGLVIALGLAIISARGAAGGMVTGLNIVFDVEEGRSFLRSNLVALAITLGAVIGLALVALSVTLTAALPGILAPLFGHALVFLAGFAGAAVLYRRAPARPTLGWGATVPGALLFAAGWLVATLAFTAYVSNFGNYNATYGSLGAVVILLTWFYASAYILLLGAEMSAVSAREQG